MKKHWAVLLTMTLTAAAFASMGTQTMVFAADGKQKEIIEAETFAMPTGVESSSIFVKAIEGISDDFIRGVDVSSVLAEEQSGVKYYGEDGTEQDIFKTLAQAGVNAVRLRVWNDPYDEDGNGYGGGNNDIATAIELGKRAARYGMKVFVDFHYSDFWADPKRQHAPKAWEGMSVEEKCEALYEFTKESLSQMLEEGIEVQMVQVGNEINHAMSGEESEQNIHMLLNAGSKAVREISNAYEQDMKVVIHYTNVNAEGEVSGLVSGLEEDAVDYDIIGLSYYPFWHGDTDNLQSVVKDIQEKTSKQVMIAETSYAYTSEDGDGSGNSFVGLDDIVEGYPATVQGQASMIRDVCAAANETDMIGVFYWEPAWIPVGPADVDNSAIWEQYGSGWASSYAADYDPEDAGLYYGGCSWDNQAMFDFSGHPLASLNVWKYLKYGAVGEKAVESVPDVNVEIAAGDELFLPETAVVRYNDSTTAEELVTWDTEELEAVDTVNGGDYDVKGTLTDGTEVTAHVKVSLINFIGNPSFEEEDTSMWRVSYEGEENPTDFLKNPNDAYTGETAFHWYSEQDMSFNIEQEITDLTEGTYQVSLFAQGGDVNDSASAELYVMIDEEETSVPFMVTSWRAWQTPVISDLKVEEGQSVRVGVRATMNAKSWGTIDEITLHRAGDF